MVRNADRLLRLSIIATLVAVACGRGEDADTGKKLLETTPSSEGQKSDVAGSPPYEAVEVSSSGTVRGTVRLSGDAPILSPIPVSNDQEVCGPEIPNIALQLGSGAAIEGAVVSLVGVPRGKALSFLSRNAELELIKCNGVPRIQIVPVGTTLEIYNSDPLLHDIYADSGPEEELFRIALPFQHFRARIELDRSGMIHLRCGAGHPWMRAYIFVQEHPYSALTNARGTYVLSDIPPGSYDLRVWHELLGQKEAPVTVEAETTVSVDFEFEYAADKPAVNQRK
jgi:hypothetical protein